MLSRHNCPDTPCIVYHLLPTVNTNVQMPVWFSDSLISQPPKVIAAYVVAQYFFSYFFIYYLLVYAVKVATWC